MICHCIKYYISDQLWSTVIQINLSDVVFQANMWCLLIFEMNNDAIFCLPATVACAFTSAVVFHHIGHRSLPLFSGEPDLPKCTWVRKQFVVFVGVLFLLQTVYIETDVRSLVDLPLETLSHKTPRCFFDPEICARDLADVCVGVFTLHGSCFPGTHLDLHLRLSVTSMMGMSVFCKQRWIFFLCQHLKCFNLCRVTHGCRLFKSPSAWIYISALWSPVISARLASQWRTMSSQALWENPKRITLYTHITFTPGANLSAIFAGVQLKK